MTELDALLFRLGACKDAREWAEDQPDLQTAWKNCKRSDWMLWLLNKTMADKNEPRFRLMGCDFAEAVLHLVKDGENRPRKAIEVARKFAAGDATQKELDDARGAAWEAVMDAAMDASRADARYAAKDDIMDAARDAARGAAWSSARGNAWADAWASAWAASRAAAKFTDIADARGQQADIIRTYFPECPNSENK